MLQVKNYKRLLLILLCIYPISSLEIFYNNFATLIQIVFITIFLLWTFFINKDSRKNIKYLIFYVIVLLIYGIFHHLNALDFHSLVPGDFHYNYIDEILYLVKMSIPVFFIYLMYYSNLEKEDYRKVIKSWIILIGGSIIITNILGISLSSYNNEVIKGSIFSWFSNNYIYNELASKGFFMYANQIACLLVVLIPLDAYFFFEDKLNILYMAIIMLAALMLGTRVSNLGSIMVLIASILAYMFFGILKKEKLQWKKLGLCGIIVIIYASILPFSPTFSRYEVYDYLMPKSIKGLVASTADTYISDIEYIKNHYEEKLINENFILNSYPYEYDPEFWLGILNEPINKRADYRYLEISMVKRVVEINDNKKDIWLGITNDRIQNIFNIERDYVLQYYAFGVIGCILFLGIYVGLWILSIVKLIKKINYFRTSIVASITLLLLIAYLTGNIFNQIAIFIPLLFLSSLTFTKNDFLKHTCKKNEKIKF